MKTPIEQVLEGFANVQPIHFLGVAIIAVIAVPLMIYRYRRPNIGLRKNTKGDWVSSTEALMENATEEQKEQARRLTGYKG